MAHQKGIILMPLLHRRLAVCISVLSYSIKRKESFTALFFRLCGCFYSWITLQNLFNQLEVQHLHLWWFMSAWDVLLLWWFGVFPFCERCIAVMRFHIMLLTNNYKYAILCIIQVMYKCNFLTLHCFYLYDL